MMSAVEMKMIDLRSDTVTLPTAAMMSAMQSAPLGDDVYGEDPTVAKLEGHVASLLGFQAGLFMASGSMANLCAMLTHCPRGARVICGDQSHIYLYEAGGASVLGGMMLHPLRNTSDGTFEQEPLEDALQSPDDPHIAPAGLLALENTQATCGGIPVDATRTSQLCAAAHARGVPVHVDGARLFNAAVALGVTPASLLKDADSVQVCFSKGLCAPVGSMLAGSSDFIARARRVRKLVGGGMRQVGVLAAACQVAVDEMVARLADDHRRARELAMKLRGATALRIDEPRTNIVALHAGRGRVETMLAAFKAQGVLASDLDESRIRFVLHAGIDDALASKAASSIQGVLAKISPAVA